MFYGPSQSQIHVLVAWCELFTLRVGTIGWIGLEIPLPISAWRQLLSEDGLLFVGLNLANSSVTDVLQVQTTDLPFRINLFKHKTKSMNFCRNAGSVRQMKKNISAFT